MKITLSIREVRSLDLSEYECCRLSTTRGIAWVTMEGNPEDFTLQAESPLKFTGPGRLVMESLTTEMTVEIQLTAPHPAVIREQVVSLS